MTADFGSATLTIGGGVIKNVEMAGWVQGSDYNDDFNMRNSGGYGGGDVVFAGKGDDRVVAGYYTSNIFGEDGNDFLDGRPSQYLQRIDGGAGDDTIYTSTSGSTVSYGGDGNDTIYSYGQTYGGAGNDTINVQYSYYSGNVFGEDGDDTINLATNIYSSGVIAGGNGADTINGGGNNDRLYSGNWISIDNSWFGNWSDNGTERDKIFGNGGNDTIFIGYGDDADGGAGSDTLHLSLDGASAATTIDLTDITGPEPFSFAGGTIKNFESFDTLNGSHFADTVVVGTHSYRVTVNGLGGNDKVVSNLSSITFAGGLGDDTLVSGGAADVFDGGDGFDTIDYSTYAKGVSVSLVTGTGQGGDSFQNVEAVIGSAYADTLKGDGNANTLAGGGGNDILDGGLEADRMDGGDGNDTYYVDNIGDTVIEWDHGGNGGQDEVFASINYTLGNQVESLTLTGTGALNGTGNVKANMIVGNDGANVLSGLGGNDQLYGGGGKDVLDGGVGADRMFGGDGDDTYYVDDAGDRVIEWDNGGNGGKDIVYASVDYTLSDQVELLTLTGTSALNGTGSVKANMIVGNSSANVLSGLGGNDQLYGGGGNDTLDGGTGGDLLKGGAGEDIFLFGLTSGKDTIVDFQAGDKIDLSAWLGTGAEPIVSMNGRDAVITLSGSDSITLTGVDVSHLRVTSTGFDYL